MSPRRSAADAALTRQAIVSETVAEASREGLESVTIGRLAEGLGMSKAGVIGHFGNKQGLQLAALAAAIEVFRREIWEPAAEQPPGLPRLAAIVDGWLSYLERDVFPGGCFVTAASCEFDGRPGPVREALDDALSGWLGALEREVRAAIDAGELPPDTDPAQVAFELNSVAMGVNQALQLRGDPNAVRRGRRAMRRALRLSERESAA